MLDRLTVPEVTSPVPGLGTTRIAKASFVTALLVTLACGAGSRSAAQPVVVAAATPADTDAMAALREHHRYHHHGGATLFIAMSIDTLGISDEQREAVRKARVELQARMLDARLAEQMLMNALADGLAQSMFDATRVDAAIARVTAAAAALYDASTAALDDLHRALTPEERGALADKVLAHWAVWRAANAEEGTGTDTEGDALARLARDFSLSIDQVNAIRAGLGEKMRGAPPLAANEIAEQLQTFGDAFRRDQFDAKALSGTAAANVHLVGWGAAHMARFVETASGVLTLEQRTMFAARLRDHAAHDPSAEVNL